MVPTSDTEETAREFTTLFADGSFAEAAGLLTDDGREAVVESFPEKFREESMDTEDALEQYRWGLHGQYGDAEGVGEVNVDGDEVAEDAVFVAGHSQGGMCAPRIADRHGGVAGVVNLDGPADPIVDPDDLAFLRYSIELDGDLSEEQEAQLEAQRETFRRIADGDFEDTDTLMGKPGIWHRSAMGCDPAGTASALDIPVFVMKTGRADEEMQPELFDSLREWFENWQDADLANGSRFEFYENVDHYFQKGPTPVTMTSLYFGGNVAEYIVADLASWIHDVAS